MKINLTTRYNFGETLNETIGKKRITGSITGISIEIKSNELANEVYTLESGGIFKIPRIDFRIKHPLLKYSNSYKNKNHKQPFLLRHFATPPPKEDTVFAYAPAPNVSPFGASARRAREENQH